MKRSLVAVVIAAALWLLAFPALAENCNPQASGQQATTAAQTEITCNQAGQVVADGWTFSGSSTASGVLSYTSPGPANGIIDTTGYQTVSFQVESIGTSNTIHVEVSNDNVTWLQSGACFNSSNGLSFVTLSSTNFAVCQVYARYMRINVTAYTSGTITIAVVAKAGQVSAYNAVVQQGSTAASSVLWFMQAKGATTGGLTNFRVNAAATTNATSIKATAGQLYGWCLTNAAAALRYVRLFNLATAPTVGTSTPTQTIILAANGGQVCQTSDIGIAYSAGISYDITGANGDADATAVTANDVSGAIFYQ